MQAAAYLIYLGIMSFRSGAKTLDTNDIEGRRPNRTWFVQGFVNNLLNPKGTLFYLGVFTMVITPETSASAMLLLIFMHDAGQRVFLAVLRLHAGSADYP